ncbi:DUF6531 domain-containing protein [Polaromonas sp.]|uniref:DUF6531 domain-containing protein n=1 Tax=Polaromonas sp. TaxID=1869339 RepID=UPI003264FE4B
MTVTRLLLGLKNLFKRTVKVLALAALLTFGFGTNAANSIEIVPKEFQYYYYVGGQPIFPTALQACEAYLPVWKALQSPRVAYVVSAEPGFESCVFHYTTTEPCCGGVPAGASANIGYTIYSGWSSSVCPVNSEEAGSTCICKIGLVAKDGKCLPPSLKAEQCTPQDGALAGNPIIPVTGEKLHVEYDYHSSSAQPLNFARTFRAGWGADGYRTRSALGTTWRHNYEPQLAYTDGGGGASQDSLLLSFGDGSVRSFSRYRGSGIWTSDNDADRLTKIGSDYSYVSSDDDSTWLFNAAGKLLTHTDRNGWVKSFAYNNRGLLANVNNQFGVSISFSYNDADQLAEVNFPEGLAISFAYDGVTAASRLTTVTYPGISGGTVSKTYLYENATFPQLLTGINDELGVRLATYAYDAQGRGISTQHAGGADLYTVSYPSSASAGTMVTDPLGTQRTYNYSTNKGKLAVTGSDKPSGTGAASAASRVQDANGFITQETDFLGVNTMYTWDINRRLPLTTTKASGLPEVQTTSTQWHATFRLPVLVTEAGRTTAYSYDTQGNPLSRTETDTATNVTRSSSWTYNPQGLVATQSSNNIVQQTYAYYPSTSFSGTAPNEVGHTAGDLQSITNGAGHVTQFTQYDRAGRVRQMIDPKGIVTDTVYTPRGWVASTTVTPPGGVARTTTYNYDNAGQLTGVTLPDSTTMSYSYDAAHRLTGVTDAKGNTVSYTLDGMGNKTAEQIKDPQGNLQRNITRVYDALNRVQQTTGASN